MKKYFLYILIGFLFYNFVFCYNDVTMNGFSDISFNLRSSDDILVENWFIYNTFYFEIYYYNENRVLDVIKGIDDCYSFIIKDLDFAFFNNYKKVKVYIYKNQKDYLNKTKISHWAGGHAILYGQKTIYTFEQKNLLRDILAHELTHLVFDSYIGIPRNANLTWLHEGLAVYEDKRFSRKKWNMKHLLKQKVPHLREILKYNSGLDNNSNQVSTWYMYVGTLVMFLFQVDRTGFKLFCDNFKTYKNVDMALSSTYPWNFKNIDELDIAWRKWLFEQKEYI